MNDSPRVQDPFASPKSPPGRPATASTAIRPQWLEVTLFAVFTVLLATGFCLAVVGLIAVGAPGSVWASVAFRFIIGWVWVASFVGSFIVLRALRSAMLPQGLSPGHAIVVSIVCGLVLYVPTAVLVGGIYQVFQGEFPPGPCTFALGSLPWFTAGALVCMIPRRTVWFWPALFALLHALAISILGTWEVAAAKPLLTFQNPSPYDVVLPGLFFHLGRLVTIGWVLSLALRELGSGRHRDWLHYTGIACGVMYLLAGSVVAALDGST